MPATSLISSVIATGDRPGFLAQAVRYWQRQTHPNRELIIVDDSAAASNGASAGMRSIAVTRRPLGEKLNIGIDAARGDIIHKWDDDDIYGPNFLGTALDALESPDITKRFVLWDCFHLYLAWNRRLYFSGHGHKSGASLCFGREIWESTPFRDIPHAVDSWFIADHDHSFQSVCAPDELVIVRHRSNTWTKFWETDVDLYIESELEPNTAPLGDFIEPCDAAFYDHVFDELRSSETQNDPYS